MCGTYAFGPQCAYIVSHFFTPTVNLFQIQRQFIFISQSGSTRVMHFLGCHLQITLFIHCCEVINRKHIVSFIFSELFLSHSGFDLSFKISSNMSFFTGKYFLHRMRKGLWCHRSLKRAKTNVPMAQQQAILHLLLVRLSTHVGWTFFLMKKTVKVLIGVFCPLRPADVHSISVRVQELPGHPPQLPVPHAPDGRRPYALAQRWVRNPWSMLRQWSVWSSR